jgi:hypothetical protein
MKESPEFIPVLYYSHVFPWLLGCIRPLQSTCNSKLYFQIMVIEIILRKSINNIKPNSNQCTKLLVMKKEN